MEVRTYTVKIEPCEEGGYWAFVPALPGCFTQGETLDEVVRMTREAIEGFVEVLAEKGQPIPVEHHDPRFLTLDIDVKTPIGA
jgi:predicted RNase H-like HicB family nuclease